MGQKQTSFDQIAERVESRAGTLPLSGRYHRLPRKITDDYILHEDALGSGLNGVVRKASSRSDPGAKFAVKAFALRGVTGEAKTNLETEVEVFLVMDHPHITRLFDVYEDEDELNLVMECMEGGELFDRVTQLKRFSEKDSANTTRQMLLALNYLHSHGMVHRDLKLENFLYDKKDSDHLKLIDFGFSKVWDPNIKMHLSCGTLSYVAPEVLHKSYTKQCDLWSLGVVVFILLAGYMPFSGPEKEQTSRICSGQYKLKPERWNNISKLALDFVQSLLRVSPDERLTSATALEHDWIAQRHKLQDQHVDSGVANALREFGSASKFRRTCMGMMAWSLSNEDRAKVRNEFIKMDKNQQGTITIQELKAVLTSEFKIMDNAEVQLVFDSLDTNSDQEIHYSDFLAAMCNSRITMHDHLLEQAFKKFDADSSGYITKENLQQILGRSSSDAEIDAFLSEADQLKDGRISYPEFVSYCRGSPLDASGVIDREQQQDAGASSRTTLRRPAPPAKVAKQSPVQRISGAFSRRGSGASSKETTCGACVVL